MIFVGLIFAAFLIILVLKVTQGRKQRKVLPRGGETERGREVPANYYDKLAAVNLQEEPPVGRTTLTDSVLTRSGFSSSILAGKKPVSEAAALREKSGLEKINQLPKMQQAVMWAELLGKPKSERM
ncbi:MAG: hypothetical protein DRP57_04700 [Spirochaetes bacterium]|nr:MAG: hypothetical protein DRP57_04700 [Spirochaetota bacterium]